MNRLPKKKYDKMINRLVALAYENNLSEVLEITRVIRANTISSSLPEPVLLRDTILLLESSGIRYALIGGLAVNVHGVPRGTEDIDFLVDDLPDLGNKALLKKFNFYGGKRSIFTTLDHKTGVVDLLLAHTKIRQFAMKNFHKIRIHSA